MQNSDEIRLATKPDQLRLPPKTLLQAVDAFLLLHTGRLAPTYRDWSARRLRHLMNTLGPETPLVEIRIWHLDLWFSELAGRETLYQDHENREPIVGRKLSPATLHGYVRCIKTFFNWLSRRRFLENNPAMALGLPPLPELPPKHATGAEVRALLKAARERNERDYAAIRLLAASGIRIGGLERLRVQDVDLAQRMVLVREKGRGGSNKSRMVPMDQKTAEAIRRCMSGQRRSRPSESLFVSRYGRPLTGSAVRQMMRRNSRRAGLRRIITPHMLRHYFGFESVRRKLPLRVVQQIMGHESSQTTELYTKFTGTELRDAFDQAFRPEMDLEDRGQD